jgi:SAM-dependent methyltransferase
MERDHLDLVTAHQTLEQAYHQLVHDYRAIEQDYSAFRRTFQRLTRPTLHSNHYGISSEPSSIDSMPIPPPLLRYWVAGEDDLSWFLTSGQRGINALRDILAPHGIQLATFTRILDFGCGCGRVLRHLPAATTATIDGTDSNADTIQWCADHLTFARFAVNPLEPPLAYPDQTFDLIYAFSVFTHLPGPLQQSWFVELHRCLKPGGYLIISTHGDYYLPHLSQAEQVAYQSGSLVLHHQDHFGENICAAFHPEPSIRNLVASKFAVISFIPEGAQGNPHQDLFLLQAL